MAFITSDIYLPEVEESVPCQLYFPTDLNPNWGPGIGQVKGVITLLHGMGGRGADWMQMTAAPRYAADNGYILVAPSVGNTFYNNMAFGPQMYTMISELLPAQLQKIFNIPTAREQNFIAGLSMGGYGALRIGLSHPERYAAIGCFSGAMDIAGLIAAADMFPPEYRRMMQGILGPQLEVTEDVDAFALTKKVAALPGAEQPRIYCSCGSRDAQVKPAFDRYKAETAGLPLDIQFEEWDGVHEWNFWDRSLAAFIGFAQNSDYGQRKLNDWNTPLV